MNVYPNYYKKISLFFFTKYKNERKQHKFRRQKKIKKSDFYNKNKKIFNINDINVNKILVSKKEKYGKQNSFKYFIEYNDNDVIKLLYLQLSQMTGYINKFNEHKQCLLRLKITNFLKITIKHGKKLKN